tara:strand:+ start:1013 stop:1702 length:690 start_codon:yes stop_codon:yes gene_type:complete
MPTLNYKKTYWLKIPLFDNLFIKILNYNRNKIHNIFLNETEYTIKNSILDIGTTNSEDNSQNVILQKTRDNDKVYCLSNQDITNLKNIFPNIKEFIIADGKSSELKENFVDIVFSSATIEHVGSFENQLLFLKEAIRIAKKTVFITTPNRFYPIDFHTKIPVIHWLPKNIHRLILKTLGLHFYANEENLNLLDKKNIIKLIQKLKIKKYKIIRHKFLFMTSNYIIIINK